MLTNPAKMRLIKTDFHTANGYGYGTNMSPHDHGIPLNESQHYVIDSTHPGGALDDGVEHRLHVRRRAADDSEHLGGCRLMLHGFAQFCVALLNLVEQPNVFDGDYRLVRKCFDEVNLPLCERFHN